MNVIATCSLDVCTDCLLLIANGDLPEDRPELNQEIDAQWGEVSTATCDAHGAVHGSLRWDLVCGGEHEDPHGDSHFSWSGCESCGSRLGGDRHAATALLVRR